MLAGILSASCVSSGEGDPNDEVVVGSAFYSLTSDSIQWLNGTYTACAGRSGSWSTRVSGNGAMDNPALTVVKNDAACTLTVTAVVADQTYTASPPVVLGTSFAASPSTFANGGSQFLANAKIDSLSFAADFQISFVYGDGAAPPVTSSNVNAAYATVQSTAVVTSVAAPTYTLDITGLRFQADPIKLIFGVSGSAILNAGALTGSAYVIEGGSLSATPTYAQVQAAYDNIFLTPKAISSATQAIPASEFNVVTLSLFSSTQVRNVIVKRTVGGIAAYQVFRVTFTS